MDLFDGEGVDFGDFDSPFGGEGEDDLTAAFDDLVP